MNENTYYTPGKVLISGEYVILYGAKGLALPVNFGQTLKIRKVSGKRGHFNWNSYDQNVLWFSTEMDIHSERIISTSDRKVSHTLMHLLRVIKLLNPGLFSTGYDVEAHINFNRNWGFGTSSTLIVNLAKWAQLDPYELLHSFSNGSGYDLAVGMENAPLIYWKLNGRRKTKKVAFCPEFSNQLYFVYLNRKQVTEESILKLRHNVKNADKYVKRINTLTKAMLSARDINEFEFSMEQHERTISEFIGEECVKNRLFPDFNGKIKSLGAWGGDFIMATWSKDMDTFYDYFQSKGYERIFKFDELICKNKEYAGEF